MAVATFGGVVVRASAGSVQALPPAPQIKAQPLLRHPSQPPPGLVDFMVWLPGCIPRR
jgi:hypothetical protein